MEVSDHGREFIKSFEGEILKVYLDPVGLSTLGVGHLLTKAELAQMPVGTPITKEQSDEYLRRDLKRFEDLMNAEALPATQNQFDAMVSLAFNIGESGFLRSSVLRYHKHESYLSAANSFMLWNRSGGRVLKGLTRRRRAEQVLYLS